MATKKKPVDQYHHGDLRSAIVGTAWKVVSKSGVDALSLRAVAEVLGVSHAAPGHHFAGKDGLIEALRQEAWKRSDELEPGLKEKDPLRATGRADVKFARAHPRQVELMFRSGGEPSVDSLRAWNAVASAAKQQLGSSSPADAVVAWAMVHGVASLLLGGALPDEVDEDDLIERALSCVAKGLRK